MNKEEIFQKLTHLFASKINYSGEFSSLFFIEEVQGRLKINFLNKQHYDFILKHLINDILEEVNERVVFGYLKLKTSPITLKNPVIEEIITVVKQTRIKPKVELPTIKNKTIKQIEHFMFDEYDKIKEDNLKLIDEYKEKNKNLYESVRWADNWGTN
jgi:hypothetical protein